MTRILLGICLFFLSLTAHADGPARVVSIGGALTEIVYGLEAGELLVGSDTTSYFPPQAGQLPKVGYQRTLSAEGILSLSPDLVILSEEAGPPAVLEQLKTAGVEMLQVKAGRSLNDIKENIRTIGDAINKQQEAEKLIRQMTATNRKLDKAVSDQTDKKRIMFILQHSGGAPMVAGTNTAASSIIELSGAQNAVKGYSGYKPLSPEAAVSLAPDIILVTTQGLAQAGGKEALSKIPGIGLTPAAQQDHVIAMDALFLLGFGPRTAEAALELNRRAGDL